jgi:hypothetical protein
MIFTRVKRHVQRKQQDLSMSEKERPMIPLSPLLFNHHRVAGSRKSITTPIGDNHTCAAAISAQLYLFDRVDIR